MTGTQKLIGWALFAVIALILVVASIPDRGRTEGYKGSYLGRSVEGQQANAAQPQNLNSRAAMQRF
jgi:hypothetical protein